MMITGAMLLLCHVTYGQWDLPGNTGTDPANDYVGTTDDERLTFRTDAVQRLQLNESETYTIGSFSLIPADGFAALIGEPNFLTNAPGPFSRLHLAHSVSGQNTQAIGFRPWMKNGINFTGNNDQMYIGQKYTTEDLQDPDADDDLDYTDAVIQWSDNPGTDLGDRMRFIFTSNYLSTSTSGNHSLEGLEAIQLRPAEGGSEVLVGIGDWFGQSEEPEERLDILDGKLRVRDLPNDPDTDDDKVMVVDNNGVVHWRDANTFASADLDWFRTANNDVVTGWPNPNGYPENGDKVGIGLDFPKTKLHVLEVKTTGGVTAGIRSDIITDDVENIGVQTFATGTNQYSNFGFRSLVANAEYNTGAYCAAYGGKQAVGVLNSPPRSGI